MRRPTRVITNVGYYT